MLDFNKKLSSTKIEKKIDPVEIYETLDRSSETGPLRPVQRRILDKWFNEKKDKKDIILKLHTGQGKTLIGLLVLQSNINREKGAALYICPNKHLAIQTSEQAKKFGIPHILFDEESVLPNDFLEGKKILITHVQKVFNGLTKFGLNRQSIKVSAVVLDDSHACIESIKDSFTIQIANNDSAYLDIIELFEEDLKSQGLGTYQEIRQQEYESILPIPYWSWMEKSERLMNILSKYREENCIKFQWPLLKNNLKNCHCVVSGKKIEITPYVNPIQQFGTFAEADQRILMSATTLEDSFFIKGLGLGIEAVRNPLKDEEETWSGEKIILIPSLIDESLDRIKVINEVVVPNPKRKFGLVVLVPSFKKTELYKKQECIVSTSKTIYEEVLQLKNGNYEKPLIIANRYDGIDLPDDSCRVLIIDSKPYSESLNDQYEELCRPHSDLINIRLAQKIEQGLGRSVRGEKDFSLIILLGEELINFIRSSKTQKYFSPQTRKQIEIGLEVVHMVKESLGDNPDPMRALYDVVKQCIITRDEGWKNYYKTEMDKIVKLDKEVNVLEILELERNAEHANAIGEHQKAHEIAQKIIDKYVTAHTEVAWYLQTIARFEYESSKVESNKYQVAAYKKNNSLLKPTKGIEYEKIGFISGSRNENIRQWLKQFADYSELMLKIDEILSRLSFGEDSEKFESALHEIGQALGFECQRPDKEIKQGPDNLWCLNNNDFFLFECKNEVKESRTEINKLETGQMNNSCGWFENNYPGAAVKPIMVIGTKTVSAGAAFTSEVEVIRKAKLNLLKSNIKAFYKELSKFELSSITDEQLQLFLTTHKLDIKSLKQEYAEKTYQQR